MAHIVDTHTHLNHEDFAGDLEETLARAQAAGVTRMIAPGYDLPSSERAVELARQYGPIFAAVGIHPHDAKSFDEPSLRRLRELAKAPKVVAIGEVGLDFHYNFSPREDQFRAFAAQARLANELGLPLIVHTREASPETTEILEREKPFTAGGVMHHFSGDEALARTAESLGFLVGIAGPVTYKKNDALRDMVKRISPDRIVVETDAPYLSPLPYRGKRNEPSYVVYVLEKLAELLEMTIDQAAEFTTTNAERVFGLNP
jgi:TatD DNase family protein